MRQGPGVGLPLDQLRAMLQAHAHFAAHWPDHFFMIIAEARSAASTSAPTAQWLERVVINLDLEGESESATKRLIDLTIYGLDTDFTA